MTRRGPSRWDVVNPHRAWFRELSRYLVGLTWTMYRRRYAAARIVFNHYADRHEVRRAFLETEWCLLRQPFYHRWSRWPDVARHMTAAGPTACVLDWGCGTGELLVWLLTQCPTWRVRGWDLDSPHFRYAQWRLARRGQGRSRPRGYDVVVCRETLEHVPNPVRVVEDLLARVAPGGVLCWDFIDAHDGGANCATPAARATVLSLLGAEHDGHGETWHRPS